MNLLLLNRTVQNKNAFISMDPTIAQNVLRFTTGENLHICRLCLSTTKIKSPIAFEDLVYIKRTYLNESVTYLDMLADLQLPMEPSLPQELCSSCATIIVNTYLFHRLARYSNKTWNEALEKLEKCLDQTDILGPTVKSVFLVMKPDEDMIFTTRKNILGNKKDMMNKIKTTIKNRHQYKKIKEKGKLFCCSKCDKTYSSCSLLMNHMKSHSKGIRFYCSLCSKDFVTDLQLEEHKERVHCPKKIQCPKCAKMFSTVRLLRDHDRNHHIAAICKVCFVQFPSKYHVRLHSDKHEVLKCPHCAKDYGNKNTFNFHLKTCGQIKEKSFFCDLCEKGYIRKNGLRTHLKTDHGFGTVYSCSWCSKKYDAVSKLRNHIVKHTREKKFICSLCNNKFVTQAALVYHTRLHTGEKPFPCDLCDQSFLSASRRMEHKHRKHFGPSKECPLCHVKFITGFHLRKHVARHSNPQSKLYVPNQIIVVE